jgi:hypothetical protein
VYRSFANVGVYPSRRVRGSPRDQAAVACLNLVKGGLLSNQVPKPWASALSVCGAVSALIAASGCASTSPVSSIAQTPTGVGGSGLLQPASPSGGCGDTLARQGGRPAWMPAPDDSVTPYVLAVPDTAAVILVAQPLRAGHPTNPYNKVAWAVRVPRNGTPIKVDARPPGETGRIVQFDVPPVVVGAGEVYVSYLDLPSPGCWTLTLRWGSPMQTATVNLFISSA